MALANKSCIITDAILSIRKETVRAFCTAGANEVTSSGLDSLINIAPEAYRGMGTFENQ